MKTIILELYWVKSGLKDENDPEAHWNVAARAVDTEQQIFHLLNTKQNKKYAKTNRITYAVLTS